MNSGSDMKLSMDELMARNRPTQMPQQPIEVHPTTKEEWVEMMDFLYTLSYHAENQTAYLKKVSELLAQLPSRTQTDERLTQMRHLEQMVEQAGNQKEEAVSPLKLRLPRLRLPHPDGPTWVVVLMALAVLLLLWWALDGAWNCLSLMLR